MIEYAYFQVTTSGATRMLNDYAAQGWQLFSLLRHAQTVDIVMERAVKAARPSAPEFVAGPSRKW